MAAKRARSQSPTLLVCSDNPDPHIQAVYRHNYLRTTVGRILDLFPHGLPEEPTDLIFKFVTECTAHVPGAQAALDKYISALEETALASSDALDALDAEMREAVCHVAATGTRFDAPSDLLREYVFEPATPLSAAVWYLLADKADMKVFDDAVYAARERIVSDALDAASSTTHAMCKYPTVAWSCSIVSDLFRPCAATAAATAYRDLLALANHPNAMPGSAEFASALTRWPSDKVVVIKGIALPGALSPRFYDA